MIQIKSLIKFQVNSSKIKIAERDTRGTASVSLQLWSAVSLGEASNNNEAHCSHSSVKFPPKAFETKHRNAHAHFLNFIAY